MHFREEVTVLLMPARARAACVVGGAIVGPVVGADGHRRRTVQH
jgi:hypothetical protein